MTLRPDPLMAPDGPVNTGFARYDPGFAEEMIEGLGQKAAP